MLKQMFHVSHGLFAKPVSIALLFMNTLTFLPQPSVKTFFFNISTFLFNFLAFPIHFLNAQIEIAH